MRARFTPRHSRWKPAVLAGALGLAATSHLRAQTAPPKITHTENVNVVAEPVPVETLSGAHTILDRQAILRTGARDVAELLRFVAVVHLSQAGSKGSLSTVTIRGAKPNFTLVLINGVPVNDISDLLGGAFNFATLSTEDIERIDILRGPLSSVYGSEAIGGVISITLRSPADRAAFRSSAEGGNYGYSAASAGASMPLHRLALSADGGYQRYGQQVLDDGSLLGTAAVQAEAPIDPSKQLSSFLRWNRLSSNSFPVSSGGPQFALSRKFETDQANQIAGAVNYQQQAGSRWFYTAGYNLFSRVAYSNAPPILDRIPPGPAYVPSSKTDSRFLRQRVETVHRLQPKQWLSIDAVAFYQHEAGTSAGSLAGVLPESYSLTRPTGFFSGNFTFTKGPWAATAGVGVEKSNTYHTVVLPRAGLHYAVGATRLRASWGQGYKLPSFYSLSNPLVGNPRLTPEFGNGYDLGVEQQFSRAHAAASLTWFDENFRDLIDFSPAIFKLVNRRSAFSRGLELESHARLRTVDFGGGVSYVDAGLRQTTERLRDVPRWTENIYLHVPLQPGLQLATETVWVGRRFDYQVPVPQDATVAGYAITNLKLTYKLREQLDGYVRVENLFDDRYHEFVGFPSPGSYVSTGLTYTLHARAGAPAQ